MSVEQAVQAAHEHDRDINLHRFPIRMEFDTWYLIGVDNVINTITVVPQ